jgi:predicted ester cyclase
MTHAGDGLGFPATGAPVHMTGMSIVQIHNGQIVEGWNALDLTTHVHTLHEIATKK